MYSDSRATRCPLGAMVRIRPHLPVGNQVDPQFSAPRGHRNQSVLAHIPQAMADYFLF